MEPEPAPAASPQARMLTLGFIGLILVATAALVAPAILEVLGLLAVLTAFVAIVVWLGGDTLTRPSADRPADGEVQMLFVECRGDQLILDGLRPTRSAAGHRVDTPFSLCLRRPETEATEASFLNLVRAAVRSEALEVTVTRQEACFRSGEREVVLPVTRVVGWS